MIGPVSARNYGSTYADSDINILVAYFTRCELDFHSPLCHHSHSSFIGIPRFAGTAARSWSRYQY